MAGEQDQERQPGTTPDKGGQQEKTFTQADIDRIINERLRRAEDTAQARLLEALGVDKLDTAKTQLEDARKRREAEMSETEKEREARLAAEKKLADFQAELQTERTARLHDKRDNALAQALAAAGAIDADEVVTVLKAKSSGDVEALLTAKGELDPDAIKALVDKARAERPHHFRPGGVGSPSNRSGEPPAVNMDADSIAAAAFLKQFGFKPNEKRLAADVNESKDKQHNNR